jgi:hypothetical protein
MSLDRMHGEAMGEAFEAVRVGEEHVRAGEFAVLMCAEPPGGTRS